MDLGELELQIFVSLVVVLGSAFVALVCDYLKGNNEQLRERNVELRVRTEEQERFAILNPSAWLSQFRESFGGGAARAAQAAPVAAEAVMHFRAPAEGLRYAADREAALAQRSADDGYRGEGGVASIPEVAGFDVAERRRARRKRGNGAGSEAKAPIANSYEWIRPEVIARVARGASSRSSHELETVSGQVAEPVERIATVSVEAVAPPPIEVAVPEPVATTFLPPAAPMQPIQLQAEIERVFRSENRPAASGPPVIMLRLLPSLKLNEELQRIVETTPAAAPSFESQLLDDVIAASATKPTPAVEEGPFLKVAEVEAEVELPNVEPIFEEIAMAAIAEPEPESIYRPELAYLLEEPLAPAAEPPLPSFALEPSAVASQFHSESPFVVNAEHPIFLEEPAQFEFPTCDALPPVTETPAYDWAQAEFAPLPETILTSDTYPVASCIGEIHAEEQAVVVVVPAEPFPEVTPEPFSDSLAELLLPTGIQDMATYRRLLEQPNPMSGIVITISINDYSRLPSTVSAGELPGLLGSVESLMGSIVRDGDFGVKVSDEQWVFVYRIDSQGFSQRRVAGLSEKLWDFQLRHLGLSNLSFSWAAVNVNAERLQDAVAAAIERMESSRRGPKKQGSARARLVVNG